MRIIAGSLGGRTLQSPKGHRTHPMSERVRAGLFNTLGDMSGLTVLDAFAGSGALSFEAISRGARYATAIDVDKHANNAIVHNAQTLDAADHVKAIHASVGSWSDNNPTSRFDIVFVAPPYDALQPKLVQKLVRHVAADGLFILDWPGKLLLPELTGLKKITTKNYGDAQIAIYRPV